jgi:hypothetical protein
MFPKETEQNVKTLLEIYENIIIVKLSTIKVKEVLPEKKITILN